MTMIIEQPSQTAEAVLEEQAELSDHAKFVTSLFTGIQPAYVGEKNVVYTFCAPDKEEYQVPPRDRRGSTSWYAGPPVKEVVFFENVALIRTTQKRQGYNKYSGALWTRWEHSESMFFSLKVSRFGRPHLRVYTKNKKAINNTTAWGFRYWKELNLDDTTEFLNNPYHVEIDIDNALYKPDGKLKLRYEIVPNLEKIRLKMVQKFILSRYYELTDGKYPKEETVDEEFFALAYPAARGIGVGGLKNSSKYVTPTIFSADVNDMQTVAKRILGTKRKVRKDVVKALKDTPNFGFVAIMQTFRNNIPLEWYLPLIKNPHDYLLCSSGMYEIHFAHHRNQNNNELVRGFLNRFTNHEIRNLLYEDNTRFNHNIGGIVRDTMMISNQIPDDRFQQIKNQVRPLTWVELHNNLAQAQRRVTVANRKLPVTEIFDTIEGTSFTVGKKTTYSILVPKDTHMLLAWGDEMNNCIGGYGPEVADGTTVVFALLDESNKMYANVEIAKNFDNKFIIRQLMMNYNQRAPEPVWKALKTHLDKLLADPKFYSKKPAQGHHGQG